MTLKENITTSIFLAIFSALPLLRLSIENTNLPRSTWRWLAGISVLLVLFYLLNYKRVQQKYVYISAGISTLLIASILISLHTPNYLACIYYIFFGLLLLATLILARGKNSTRFIALTLIASASLFAQWGSIQFILQHDLGLSKIGESILNVNTAGVASFYLHDYKFLRAYGPFAHANILGGVLVLAIMLLAYAPKQITIFTYSILTSLYIGLLTTFSRTAIASAIFLGIYIAFKEKNKLYITSLCILIIFLSPLLVSRSTDSHDVAAHDRIEGISWARNMTTPSTIIRGFGIGNYEKVLNAYLQKNSIPHYEWDIAPVHNIPIFLIMEFGIFISAIIFILVFYFIYKNNLWIILALLPAILFDHYFATQFGALAWLTSCIVILSRVY